MLWNCGVGEDSWESLGLQGDPTSPSGRRSVLGVHWKDWCWSWNSSTLATWCKELTHWKRPWCWEGLEAGGEGDDRGWDDWMTSLTRWTWVWVNSGSWWWTGRPGMQQFMGSQRVRHDWATELNWTVMFNSSEKNWIATWMISRCQPVRPTTSSSVCFLIWERRSSARREIKRVLCSRFRAVFLWNVLVNLPTKRLQNVFVSLWVHNFTLG